MLLKQPPVAAVDNVVPDDRQSLRELLGFRHFFDKKVDVLTSQMEVEGVAHTMHGETSG